MSYEGIAAVATGLISLQKAEAAQSRARQEARWHREEMETFESLLESAGQQTAFDYLRCRDAAREQRRQEEREDRRLKLKERELAVREREARATEELAQALRRRRDMLDLEGGAK